MRILPDKKSQKTFIDIYHREGRRVLLKTIQPVLARMEHINPQDLKYQVRRLLNKGEVEAYIETLWMHTGSTFAQDMVKRLSTKADTFYQLGFWDKIFRKYAAERSAKVTGKILDTEAENINRIIDTYLTQGESAGLGIQEIARNMRDNLAKDVIGMQNYEAARIAQTEVIGSANKGSFEGALSTGLELTKTWATSGSGRSRDSHLDYESQGDVPMDHEYNYGFSSGMQFPGDQNGVAEDIINCHCDMWYNDAE